jgi:hypothetical protein
MKAPRSAMARSCGTVAIFVTELATSDFWMP